MSSAVLGSKAGRAVRTNQPWKCWSRVVRAAGRLPRGRESNTQRASTMPSPPSGPVVRTRAPPGYSSTVSTTASTRRTLGLPARSRPTRDSKSSERIIL